MKLQQLRYALEVYRHNLNVSEAADALFTSQPGVSKQIRLLEEELGIQIFIRSGKRIVAVSQPGKAVLQTAERILHDIQNIKNIGKEFTGQDSGTLHIAATHSAARYLLPPVISEFARRYPKVRLRIRQDTPAALSRLVADGEADFALSSELAHGNHELRSIPCERRRHALIVPEGHPLAGRDSRITLHELARYPLIACEDAFNRGSLIDRAFHKANLGEPDIILSAANADILKSHVAQGLGIGLIEYAAYDPQQDGKLHITDATHLFEPAYNGILLRADTYLRGYIYDFLHMLSPELDKARVDKLLYAPWEEDFSI